MRSELRHIEWIENYLTGRLSPQEHAAFAARIEASPALAADVRIQQQIMSRIDTNAFEAAVMDFHDHYTGGRSSGLTQTVFLNTLVVLVVTGAVLWAVLSFMPGNKDVRNRVEQTALQRVLPDEEWQVNHASALSEVKQEPKNQVHNANKSADRKKQPDRNLHGLMNPSMDRNTPGREPVNPGLPDADFKVPYYTTQILADAGALVWDSVSNTVIRIPAGSLTYKNGLKVRGAVKIQFRVFRNTAEMALAGIPVTGSEAGGPFRVNPAGVLEIHAYKNSNELYMAAGKSFSVDFTGMAITDSTKFFALDESNGNWNPVNLRDTLRESDYIYFSDPDMSAKYNQRKQKEFRKWKQFMHNFLGRENAEPVKREEVVSGERKEENNQVNNQQSPLRKSSSVNRIRSSTFGVFSCGTPAAVANDITVSATYTDESGNSIGKPEILLLIRADNKDVYTRTPASFSAEANTVYSLLLITADKKVFRLDEKEFGKMKITDGGTCNFRMQDVSRQVRRTSDFSKYF